MLEKTNVKWLIEEYILDDDVRLLTLGIKSLDAVEKKFGGKVGHGADDPAKMRSTNEKIVGLGFLL